MRILDFLTHPPFQYTLAKSGHDFVVAASEMYAGWPEQLPPLPDNTEVVEVPEDPGSFDVVIVSTPEQYSRIDGRVDPGRIVFLSHTVLHPWDVEFFCRLPADVEVVYVSDHKRASFGRLGKRGRTIPLGVDAGEFDGYSGEQPTVLNVTNRYARQEDREYPLFRGLTKGLDSQVVGHGNEEIPGAYPATDFEHLQQIYRQHRCFVNTDAQGRLHLCTLEALATGMPLVTVPTAELEPRVQGGVNAL